MNWPIALSELYDTEELLLFLGDSNNNVRAVFSKPDRVGLRLLSTALNIIE